MSDSLTTANAAAHSSPPTGAPTRAPRRWVRWVLGSLALVVVLAVVVLQLLDPWLRRTLEKQVTEQTQGQYRLQVGELRTSLWQRAVRLQNVRLRPAAQVADTLPRMRLDVARLHVTGIGLLALLRKGVVPIDSVVLDSVRVEVLALAAKPTKNAGQPLHQRLPLQLEGLEIGYVGLLHTQASYLPQTQTTAQFERADLSARNLLISAAGAADTQRLGYASDWRLRVLRGQGRAAGHTLAVAGLQLTTAEQLLLVDSLHVQPTGSQTAAQPRVTLLLPRLRLTGLDAAKLRQHRFRADSLLLLGPQLTAARRPAIPHRAPSQTPPFCRQFDLAHVAVRRGYLRLKGSTGEPTVRDIAVRGTGLHLDSTLVPKAGSILFARAWDVALGRSNATVAAHAVALDSLRLSTKAGTFDLRAVRDSGRRRPGRGPRGQLKSTLRCRTWPWRGSMPRPCSSGNSFRPTTCCWKAPG